MSNLIEAVYNFLWGDLITMNIKGTVIGIPLLVILLVPAGIYFTIRTRFMPIRKLPQMIKAVGEKNDDKSSLSTFQTLIVSTATRVGMGNLVHQYKIGGCSEAAVCDNIRHFKGGQCTGNC